LSTIVSGTRILRHKVRPSAPCISVTVNANFGRKAHVLGYLRHHVRIFPDWNGPKLLRRLACVRHDLLHARHQRRRVIRDAVLDRPFDAAGVHLLAVANLVRARPEEYFQLLHWLAVDYDQVREETCAHPSEPLLLSEDLR